MVAAISTNSTPRFPKTPPSSTLHHRPPLSPSEKTNNNNADDNSISRNARSKAIATSRHSLPSTSNSLPKRSQSTNRPRPAAESPRPMSITTTRSLSVSFQGQSFSFQTAKPKPISQTPPTMPRNSISAKTRQPNSLTKSLDCSVEKKGPALAAAIRVLGHSVVFDDKDVYLASDSDSSGSQEGNGSAKGRGAARGISVPAKFWPENFSPARGKVTDAQLLSPRMASPSPVMGKSANVPSILSFAAEARRVRKGEGRIEEAHSLRLMHNRYLQWRCVNAQADAVLSAQRMNVERNLYNAWLTTSELHDSVANKRIKLQLLLQNVKLASIFKGQMIYVEEWSLMDKEHSNYLSGLITALKASTLRLPVVSGARVDIQELQNAIGSAVDVMQAMGTSVCCLLSKLEGTSTLVSELAKATAHERALLDQAKDLLSMVAALHVKQCSLQGHILQRYRNLNLQVHL